MALGVGLLGVHYNNSVMATLGFTAALLHVINHALFKSLLFFGAGSILHATHTGDIDLRQVSIGVEKLDHLTGDPKTHGSFLL